MMNLFAHPLYALSDFDELVLPYSLGLCDLIWNETLNMVRRFQRITVLAYNTNEPVNFSSNRDLRFAFAGSLSPRFWLKDGPKVRHALVKAMEDIPGSRYLHTPRKGSEQSTLRKTPNLQRRSYFCAAPVGDSPGTKRLFDTFRTGCIAIVLSDYLRLPFEETFINYENVLTQIPQYNFSLIEHTMMKMNDRWRERFHRDMAKIDKILDLTLDATLRQGDNTWGWLWMEYFKACHVSAVKRWKITYGRKYIM
jgi:hypothetical protein